MNKIYCSLFIILLYSCNNSIKGKIGYRTDRHKCYDYSIDYSSEKGKYRDKDAETKTAYLVNSSFDKAYEFTIKVIQTTNDTIIDQNTMKIKLSPGDEKWLGCTKYLDGERYNQHTVIDTFYRGDTKYFSIDDIVRIDKRIIDDSTSPKKRDIVSIKYSCTGQRLITNSKELEKQRSE